MAPPLLELTNFSLYHQQQKMELLHQLNFSIHPREIVALVGQSGSGKSLTARSILQLLDKNQFCATGLIQFYLQLLLTLCEKKMRQIRGLRIGLLSQDPAACLNPTLTMQSQLLEMVYRKNPSLKKKAAVELAVSWLERMQLPGSKTMGSYPHQLSGGMKQRAALAMALISQPTLLIADEPTTALDMTVQAEILTLFKKLVKEEEMSLLLITHDLGVVARCCDRVIVLQKGKVVEIGDVDQIFYEPKQMYTQQLLQSKQKLSMYDC